MRLRVTKKITANGGQGIMVEKLPDATIEERVQELKNTVPLDTILHILRIRCDGCGAAQTLGPTDPVLPPGWIEAETGEFCPRCASGD